MDLNKIKQVVDLMKKSDLSEFEIQDQEFKLRIKRDAHGRIASAPQTVASAPAPAAPKPAASRRNVENMATAPMMGGRRRKDRKNKNKNKTNTRRRR